MDRSYQRPAGGSSVLRLGSATTASPLRRPISSACSAVDDLLEALVAHPVEPVDLEQQERHGRVLPLYSLRFGLQRGQEAALARKAGDDVAVGLCARALAFEHAGHRSHRRVGGEDEPAGCPLLGGMPRS